MDWKSPLGIGLPLISFVFGFIAHYLLHRLNIYKFRKLGHFEMLELLNNEKKYRYNSLLRNWFYRNIEKYIKFVYAYN